jgi:UDP-2,3-diacylglucosamine hydrolase
MRQLFISDLHLWDETPELEQLFHQFMEQQASKADELYVLGDLFEAWIGDDAMDAMAKRVINAFSHFSKQGGKLFFIHGNRDFLLGDEFLKATAGSLLPDPYPITLANQQAVLMHGDSLCTQDKEYIKFRDLVRSKDWQEDFLSRTIDERTKIARDIRQQSSKRGKVLATEISDVTPSEVTTLMQEFNVSLMVHGHTHRQNRHSLTINNQPAERIVLGDWGKTGSVLSIEDNIISLTNFSLNSSS